MKLLITIKFLIAILLFIIFLFYFYETRKENYSNKIKIIKHFKTPKQKNKGLMFIKDKLPENSGALFDYSNNPQKVSFWMKNTFIPLDALFLNKNKKVIGIQENMKPHSLKSRGVNKVSHYGIELNAGTIKKNKINIGDTIQFN